MTDDYWKESLFGKNSIFAPDWDEKQKKEREKLDK